jgi:aryl-alcohol dehydrogenase-like predicted oxidoreductase
MIRRSLGRSGLNVTPIGFGAFKIGRNQGAKYPQEYALPNDEESATLLRGVLDAGINLIDTAPAYGLSEERIGMALSRRRGEFVLSTKVGEEFEQGRSRYDFSERSVRGSVSRSLMRVRSDVLDIVFIHANADDVAILDDTPAVTTLQALKRDGRIRAIGFSGKTIAAERQALDWADVLMVEYSLSDRSHAPVIADAARRGVGVVVKKGLGQGRLDPAEAIRFVLQTEGVTSLIVGGLNLDHLKANIRSAAAAMIPCPPAAWSPK